MNVRNLLLMLTNFYRVMYSHIVEAILQFCSLRMNCLWFLQVNLSQAKQLRYKYNKKLHTGYFLLLCTYMSIVLLVPNH